LVVGEGFGLSARGSRDKSQVEHRLDPATSPLHRYRAGGPNPARGPRPTPRATHAKRVVRGVQRLGHRHRIAGHRPQLRAEPNRRWVDRRPYPLGQNPVHVTLGAATIIVHRGGHSSLTAAPTQWVCTLYTSGEQVSGRRSPDVGAVESPTDRWTE